MPNGSQLGAWKPELGTKGAHTDMLMSGLLIIWFGERWPDANIIAHESFHAVHLLMPRLGIPFLPTTEEAYAYAVGSFVSMIHATLDGSR